MSSAFLALAWLFEDTPSMPRALVFVLALALGACEKAESRGPGTSAQAPDAGTSPASPPLATQAPTLAGDGTASPSSAPAPDPITHPCVVAATQYSIAIEQGSDVCKRDVDCDCYRGGIGESGCGGVLNKASVVKLDVIARRFQEMKCSLSRDCAPWLCSPRCEGGHCKR